ncbi:acyl-CoA dehydrogenase family protein [Saccharopolyspora sp. TS4A08]|uniref:Acyl-CoA dehydrogenase family protein n=1 Tax=Saccharopolyspora ipomoeae TaxID=3042027 RepID=A0ABT6PSA0_9PSEU|nr:acyl-CoA dehydrogenase family protein [Saccharopolyspora sp. TS4A08]MDI2030884.1 acyl-CoA dehydrogenase family protein [Saccharopolyspora sp. TS4A08]
MTQESPALQEARRIAEDVLFPAALEVDAAERVPESHLELLAERGFYGLAASPETTPLDVGDFSSVLRLIEVLASGCLTTTFVWIQHHGVLAAAETTKNRNLRENYLSDLVSGKRRGGIALGSALRTGPAPLRAEPVVGGYLLEGVAPWFTGWGMVDSLLVAGRTSDDTLVFAMLDVAESDVLHADPLELMAVQASGTVTLRFNRYFVPRDRIASTVPQADYLQGDSGSVRFNGALALGVAGRAIALLGDDAGGLPAELDAARASLVEAGAEELSEVRARASELAMRAASAAAVHHGSRSVLPGSHAQRLVREATFLLLFGSRPAIKSALLDRLTAPREPA